MDTFMKENKTPFIPLTIFENLKLITISKGLNIITN